MRIHPIVKGTVMKIIAHFRPMVDMRYPAAKLAGSAPRLRSEPIQLPSISSKEKSQSSMPTQSAMWGNAGDVHDMAVPRHKDPIQAEIQPNICRVSQQWGSAAIIIL
jgi:hypothetical protein